MRVVKVAVAVLVLVAAAALAGVGLPEPAGGAPEESHAGITVTGAGDVRSTPDRATLTFGVQSRGATAAAALATNSAETRRLIAALKQAGVDAKDLETDYLDVSPRYERDGYSASATVTVSNQPIQRASRIADLSVEHGADTVSGPSLSVADTKAEYRRALALAFDDAQAKAGALAAAAGVSLGEVTSIVEGSQPELYEATAMRALDAKTPIEPGSQRVSAFVTVTFALGG